MMKKWVFILCLSVALQANAACDEEGYFDCGNTGDVKWYLSNDKKTLSISGEGAMGDYSTDIQGDDIFTTAPWKAYTSDVENIVVSEGVTAVGKSTFCGFRNTASISLPNTLETIGNAAFRNLDSLKEIELPNSLVSIGQDAFLSDTGLTNVIIPDSVTTIGSMAFYNAKGLQSVIIPASVTSIGSYAFGNNCVECSLDRNIAGDVYCEQVSEGRSPCNSSGLGLSQEHFKYYAKDNFGRIVVDGQAYSSLDKLAKQIPLNRMRIYTVDEASKAAGKKNRVMIRYK